MGEADLKNKTVSGMIWKFIAQVGSTGVSLIVSIILARLLPTEVFGTLSLVTVIISLMNVFLTNGLCTALIQKKDIEPVDYSTTFYCNLILSAVLYIAVFVSAPFIASFYEIPKLELICRVLALSLILTSASTVQSAYISRNMQFKKSFFITLIGTVASGVVGVTMAYTGFGIWALVASNLTSTVVNQIVMWIVIPWRPTKEFSFKRFKPLFNFSWKMLAIAFSDTAYNNLRSLIIGKKYSVDDLAFYNKGKYYPYMLITNVNTTIDSVLFPVFSKIQDDIEAVKRFIRRSIKTSTYILAPLLLGLAAVSEPLIRVLLTDKWIFAVPYMRIFCITYVFYPVHSSNLQAMKASGRSDIVLKLEFIKKGIGLASVLITMWISVYAMALSLLVTTVISLFINVAPSKKLFGYGIKEQMFDIFPNVITAVIMAAAVYVLGFIPVPDILKLIIMVIAGIIIYIGLSMLFKLESFKYLLDMIKDFIKKRKNSVILNKEKQ